MKKHLLVLFSAFMLLLPGISMAQTLIAGWDFQTTTTGGTAAAAAPAAPLVYAANFGTGTIYLDGSNGSSTWTSLATNPQVTGFAGTNVNATNGLSTATTGASSLAIANNVSNGNFIILKFSTSGYKNLVVTYATQSTASGFDTQFWEYSTNGSTWTTVGTIAPRTSATATTFATLGIQTLPTITGLDNATTAYLRLTVTGATSTTGNNRLDNIQLNATAMPSTQATNVNFASTVQTSTTASWTNGNGAGRAVFISAGSTGSPVPVDGTSYTANAAFGSGTQIGSSGWYCVYNGTGTSVAITGLSASTTYRVATVEYNGTGATTVYSTATGTGNPANVTTTAAATSSNNNLSALTLGGGFSLNETFSSSTTSYTATVPNGTASITVTPTVADATATVTVNGNSVTSGSASGAITLSTGPNTISVVVTAQNSTTKTYTITVTVQAPSPIIASSTPTLSAQSTTYATASTAGTFNVSGTNMAAGILVTPPSGFEVSTDNTTFTGTVTVGSSGTIASTAVYVRLKASNAVGSYSGNVALTSSGATEVDVAIASSSVAKAPLTITASDANKTYGASLTGAAGSTAFTTSGLKNSETIGSVTIAYGTGSAATAAAGTYTGQVTPSAATGGTFTSSNYNITYATGNIIVAKATLSITAGNVSKTFGATLTGGAGSTAFTSTGLQNSESIGSVTITYGTGAAAADPVATYTGSVVASAATGGTFTAANYTITYVAGNITVTAAPIPAISTSGALSALSTTYGTASATGTFSVSGTNMTAGILVTPPAGFEVSSSATTGFGSSVTIGSAGTIVSTPVYIRLAATDGAGNYSGNVTLSSTGANSTTVATAVSTVSPKTLTVTAANATRVYGAVNPTFTVSYSGFVGTDNAASLTTQPTGTTTATATSPVTTYTITPAGGVAANYTFSYVAGTLTVTPATLTITASNASKVYGTALTGGAGSTVFTSTGLANAETIGSVTITYGTGSAATAAGGTYTGSVVASAATGGTFTAANYNITYAAGNITVTPVALTVTVNNATKVYGAANPAFTVNYTGFVGGDNAASLTTQPSVGTTATAASGVGSYTLTASGGVSSNYSFVYAGTGTLTITPAPLTIAADAKTRAYGLVNPTLTATYTGFAGTDNAASLATQPTFTTTAATNSLPGIYPVTVSGASSPNYTITYVAATLTVVAGNNANLAFLTISSGALSPAFGSATKAYTDTVTNAVDRISVTPNLSDAAANLQVNGTQVGSGNTSTFIPLNTGNNTITILVTAQDGVTKNIYTVTVYRASAASNITATNILSPNGDGKNDTWVIKDINLYPNNNVSVYDRGGRVVYNKHGYTNDWTGTLRGAPLAEGTYYYTVELDPKLPVIKGFITILRNR